MHHRAAALLTLSLLTSSAIAAPYQVTITGTVEYNQVTTGPLAVVQTDDPVTISIRVDSNDFLNSPNFPTRGYVIDRATFTCTLGAATLLLQGVDAKKVNDDYFTLRDNDPGVDGFMLTKGQVELDNSLPTNLNGIFGPFGIRQYNTYENVNLIPSLDIADAVGSYEFEGLSVFGFAVTDGPFDPIGIIFERTTIAAVPPECPGDANGDNEVNGADLSVLLAQFNQSVPAGTGADYNNDGVVNGADLSVLLGAFGNSCGTL